jgi:hypothetical protein
MEQNNFYSLVPVWSSISEDLLAYAHTVAPEYWTTYYNFEAIPAPLEILGQDTFLVALAKKRKFHAGILRMKPNTCYNWHVDTDRKVGLNMLLNEDGDSHCVFVNGEPGVVFGVEELKYEPDSYYVFNTQVAHMVLNTAQPRYLFSLEFLEEDRGLTFDELCEDIKGMNHGY